MTVYCFDLKPLSCSIIKKSDFFLMFDLVVSIDFKQKEYHLYIMSSIKYNLHRKNCIMFAKSIFPSHLINAKAYMKYKHI